MRNCYILPLKDWNNDLNFDLNYDDKLAVRISRKMVETRDIVKLSQFFSSLTPQPEKFAASITLLYDDYKEDVRAVYEIPEIREFFSLIYEKFPPLLLFLNREQINGNSDFEIFFLMLSELNIFREKIQGTLFQLDTKNSINLISQSLRATGHLLQTTKLTFEIQEEMVKDIVSSYSSLFPK